MWTDSTQSVRMVAWTAAAVSHKTGQLLLDRIEITDQGKNRPEAKGVLRFLAAILRHRGFDIRIPSSNFAQIIGQHLLHFSDRGRHGVRTINDIGNLDVVLQIACFGRLNSDGAQNGKAHTKAGQPTQNESSMRRTLYHRIEILEQRPTLAWQAGVWRNSEGRPHACYEERARREDASQRLPSKRLVSALSSFCNIIAALPSIEHRKPEPWSTTLRE